MFIRTLSATTDPGFMSQKLDILATLPWLMTYQQKLTLVGSQRETPQSESESDEITQGETRQSSWMAIPTNESERSDKLLLWPSDLDRNAQGESQRSESESSGKLLVWPSDLDKSHKSTQGESQQSVKTRKSQHIS